MFKFVAIGLIGAFAAFGGIWFNFHLKHQQNEKTSEAGDHLALVHVKTEMTGIPVVVNGNVSGYLVFQISSSVDPSKLSSKDFDVGPYLLDAAIRASYESTADASLTFKAAFLEKLAYAIKDNANKKLNAEVVTDVNIEQFNFVPKDDVRGNVLAGSQKQ
jgi:hypothetical protein